MSRFWPPPADPPQQAYERLRTAVLSGGRLPDELTAARFARRGLAGLILWPDAEPVFSANLLGAARAAWTPYADPRVAVLAATYRLLLETRHDDTGQGELGQGELGQGELGQHDQPSPTAGSPRDGNDKHRQPRRHTVSSARARRSRS